MLSPVVFQLRLAVESLQVLLVQKLSVSLSKEVFSLFVVLLISLFTILFELLLFIGASVVGRSSQFEILVVESALFAALLYLLLESLLQDVELGLNLVLVAVDDSLAVHGVLVEAVGVEVLCVQLAFYLEEVTWVELKEVYDEGALAFVFLHHAEDEVSQLLGVGHLEGQRLLVEDLVHDSLDALVVEGHLQSCHVVHNNAQTEDVRPMVVSLLLDDLRAQVERRANLPRSQVGLLSHACALAKISKFEFPVFSD